MFWMPANCLNNNPLCEQPIYISITICVFQQCRWGDWMGLMGQSGTAAIKHKDTLNSNTHLCMQKTAFFGIKKNHREN